MKKDIKYIKAGVIITIIAGFLINFVLFLIYINGITILTDLPIISLLILIYMLGISSYFIHLKVQMRCKNLFKYSIPLGLIIVFIGLILLVKGDFNGAYLIIIGYLIEPIGGIAVFMEYSTIDRLISFIMFFSVSFFIITLPLVLFQLTIIPIMFNSLKILSFLVILFKVKKMF